MPFLTSEPSPGVVRKIAVDQPEMAIGRHPDCEIVIEEGAVSRRHARLYVENGNYLIEDLNSRNGTVVNNRLIHHPIRLFDGDQITICDHRFTFHVDLISDLPRPRPTIVDRSGSRSGDSVLFEESASDVQSIVSQLELSSHDGSSRLMLAITPEKRLETIVNVSRALSKTVGLEAILQAILDCLFQLFIQVDRGFIVMRDKSNRLTTRALKLRNPADDELIRVSRTIVDYVLDHRQGVLSSDAGTDARFDMSQSVADFRIRSLMCMPLFDSDGEAIGVIQLDTLRRTMGFDEQDLQLLSVVAMQASLAIENENLHDVEQLQRELRRDLELAHDVQHGFLPRHRPQIGGYEFYDYYRPARQVGGDYYDYVQLNDGRLAVILADVVGHGIAAALLMAKLAAEVRFALASEPSPAAAVSLVNQAISLLDLDRFVTLVLAMIDPASNRVTIVNAGHMQPVIRRADGSLEEPGTQFSSLPIGVERETVFVPFETEMKAGDSVLMYTDGISECCGEAGEAFTIGRVRRIVRDSASKQISDIGKEVIRELKQFMADSPQHDDICLVGFGKV